MHWYNFFFSQKSRDVKNNILNHLVPLEKNISEKEEMTGLLRVRKARKKISKDESCV